MTALPAVNDLLLRLGAELDFDVASDVASESGIVDVVWFDRSLPLAAIISEPLDLRDAPVLPIVAFIARTAAQFETSELAAIETTLEDTRAPLRILVVGRDSRPSAARTDAAVGRSVAKTGRRRGVAHADRRVVAP